MIKFFALLERFCCMARPTRLRSKLPMEHIFVLIDMALFTEAALKPIEHISIAFPRRLDWKSDITRFMAFCALIADFSMPTRQVKAGSIVLKVLKFSKSIGTVAFCTRSFLRF
jgi:hypothetical protein